LPYRVGPRMDEHLEVCRDLNFWQKYIDQMAENRFNILSLWNVHPFSFMVKPVNFPLANNYSEKKWQIGNISGHLFSVWQKIAVFNPLL
jgi:hypothetical protein